MDRQTLQEYIDLFKESGVAKMEISETEGEKSFVVKLENAVAAPVTLSVPAAPAAMPVQQTVQPTIAGEELSQVRDYNRYRDVKSPMVGIFHTSPKPGAEPYVRVGSRVRKGDILCIIEAMKLMNDITAEDEGEVVEILAEDGMLVEFGQVLFKIL